MSYSSGMLKDRVTIIHPKRVEGLTGLATGFVWGATVWAAVDWSRGSRALRQGEVEVYDVVMVRMRFRKDINRYCRLFHNGQYYVINSLNADPHANTIQITATEVGKFDVEEREEEE